MTGVHGEGREEENSKGTERMVWVESHHHLLCRISQFFLRPHFPWPFHSRESVAGGTPMKQTAYEVLSVEADTYCSYWVGVHRCVTGLQCKFGKSLLWMAKAWTSKSCTGLWRVCERLISIHAFRLDTNVWGFFLNKSLSSPLFSKALDFNGT